MCIKIPSMYHVNTKSTLDFPGIERVAAGVADLGLASKMVARSAIMLASVSMLWSPQAIQELVKSLSGSMLNGFMYGLVQLFALAMLCALLLVLLRSFTTSSSASSTSSAIKTPNNGNPPALPHPQEHDRLLEWSLEIGSVTRAVCIIVTPVCIGILYSLPVLLPAHAVHVEPFISVCCSLICVPCGIVGLITLPVSLLDVRLRLLNRSITVAILFVAAVVIVAPLIILRAQPRAAISKGTIGETNEFTHSSDSRLAAIPSSYAFPPLLALQRKNPSTVTVSDAQAEHGQCSLDTALIRTAGRNAWCARSAAGPVFMKFDLHDSYDVLAVRIRGRQCDQSAPMDNLIPCPQYVRLITVESKLTEADETWSHVGTYEANSDAVALKIIAFASPLRAQLVRLVVNDHEGVDFTNWRSLQADIIFVKHGESL